MGFGGTFGLEGGREGGEREGERGRREGEREEGRERGKEGGWREGGRGERGRERGGGRDGGGREGIGREKMVKRSHRPTGYKTLHFPKKDNLSTKHKMDGPLFSSVPLYTLTGDFPGAKDDEVGGVSPDGNPPEEVEVGVTCLKEPAAEKLM